MGHLTTEAQARYEVRLKEIADGRITWWTVGEAIADIKEHRWYKDTHDRFDDFCIEVLGRSASHIRQLASLSAIKEAKSVEAAAPGERAKPMPEALVVPAGIELLNAHRATLAMLPEPARQGVLDEAVEIAEKAMPAGAERPRLTATIIKEAAANVTEDAPPDMDTAVACLADRAIYLDLQAQIKTLQGQLKSLKSRTSSAFLSISMMVASLQDAWNGLKFGMPYCWCTECGGGINEREDCATCKGLGFNSLGMFRLADKEHQEGARLWNSATTN